MKEEARMFRLLQDNHVPIEKYYDSKDEDASMETALDYLLDDSTQEERGFVVDLLRANGLPLPAWIEEYEQPLKSCDGSYGCCGVYDD